MAEHLANLARILQDDPRVYLVRPKALQVGAAAIEGVAQHAARNISEREELVFNLKQDYDLDLWERLGLWWTAMVEALETGNSGSQDRFEPPYVLDTATALAKMERNLVAGISAHQAAAVAHEAALRAVIFNITTFARIEDSRFLTLQATMTQLLSNLISPVSPAKEAGGIASSKLALYLSGSREDDVIIRLLDSQDPKANTALLHLLNNITRGSRDRIEQLTCPVGLTWLSKILGRMDDWLSAEDGRFELGCKLIQSFVDHGLQARLFGELAVPNEPISPSQTTLLKILDSHLATRLTAVQSTNARERDEQISERSSSYYFLIPVFHLLSAYAHTSINHVPDDARLPKVFEALVLACEALINIGLIVQAERDQAQQQALDEESQIAAGAANAAHDNVTAEEGSPAGDHGFGDVVSSMKSPEDGEGVVRSAIDLLRSLDALIPRLNPRTARLDPSVGSAPTGVQADQLRPIAQLKRNLVQLLGVLSFEDTAVGDQVRTCEGIQLLLSMTEVDENSPYLREHALFAVRNLMLNNPANQAVIREMDPVGVLSDTGELLPVPDRMRRDQARS